MPDEAINLRLAVPADATALDRLEKWCGEIARPIAFLGVIGLLCVAAVTVLDILLRWLANSSVTALNEISDMVFAVAISACIPYGMVKGVHLKLDLFENWIVGRLAVWVNVLGLALVIVFFAMLAWRVGVYAGSLAAQGRATLILGWPKAPFMYAVTALFAGVIVIELVMLANVLIRARRYRPVPGTPESSWGALLFVVAVVAAVLGLVAYGFADFASLRRFAVQNTGTTIIIACTLLWLVLMMQVPLSAVMCLIGLGGTALFIGMNPAISVVANEVTGFLTNNLVAVLPLFLMMGSFAAVAGLADDIYSLAHAALSRLPGGLAMSTIGGCAGFGAITGSTVATAAMIGRVALPEMRSRGYDPALACGSVAAGGTLGNLVPPGSGPLVIFALLTEASIGQLFIASAIPSVLAIAAYLFTVLLYVWWVPGAAPPPQAVQASEVKKALRRCGPVTTLFLVVLGGLYTGVFTATEAAAVGAFGAFLTALLRGKLRGNAFWDVMAETTHTTALVYPLIFGALAFAFFTGVSGLTETITKFVSDLGWPPLAVIALLLIVFVALGTFMDSYAIMIITVPIVTPLITSVGYDLIWWGVLMLFVVEIGGISPPFGLTMYVLKAIENVPLKVIFKGVTPFCLSAIVVLAILTLFPSITLWLPSTMFK